MGRAIYIHHVASVVGLTPQAIRLYERSGLLEKAQRTSSGYRVYSGLTLERVRFIKQAQQLGLSLQEIREVLRLKYSGQSPCDCVRGILKQKLARLKNQMAEMERMRREIESVLRASQKFSRLPHAASLVCPLIEKKPCPREHRSRKKGGETR